MVTRLLLPPSSSMRPVLRKVVMTMKNTTGPEITDSTLIQTYAYGSTMQVIADLGGWYQVTAPVTGITGFVMKKFAFIN